VADEEGGVKKNIVLFASIAAGILAAVLTRVYISVREAEVNETRDKLLKRYGTMEVLCFKQDTPGGTVISRGDLGAITVPALGLRGQALTIDNANDIVGRKTLVGHRRGDVVFWSDVEGGDPSKLGLSSDVKRQMRAISINVSGAAAVSGMVKPNDHVDVIGTFNFPNDEGKIQRGDPVTLTILQNVLVLAIGKDTAKSRFREYGSGLNSSTVTLEVSPREAEMLAFAEQIKGRLVLTLRNRNDTSYEKELPQVDYEKIRSEIEELNLRRQQKMGAH